MPDSPTSASLDAPIGIFDSGVGGLSVLRHIRADLPEEHLLYFSDAAFAPYGDKPDAAVTERVLAVAGFLAGRGVKALVVACNTATAAAIRLLRERYPHMPIVGLEPGLKPATLLTQTGVVGVLATQGTLASSKFAELHAQLSSTTSIRFLLQPCPGLADQVEKGELASQATRVLAQRYVHPLLQQHADTLVLGCTHYPFLRPMFEQICAASAPQRVTIVETGAPVSRQLLQLLEARQIRRRAGQLGGVSGFTTGRASVLINASHRLIGLDWQVSEVAPAH